LKRVLKIKTQNNKSLMLRKQQENLEVKQKEKNKKGTVLQKKLNNESTGNEVLNAYSF
jgi:hypothetical protein